MLEEVLGPVPYRGTNEAEVLRTASSSISQDLAFSEQVGFLPPRERL